MGYDDRNIILIIFFRKWIQLPFVGQAFFRGEKNKRPIQ